LSRFFDWCQDEGFITLNPCTLVAKARRPRAVAARQHHMAPADSARLWHAAGEAAGLPEVQRDLIRFLIAVPCRRGEAATMDWAHVDLGACQWVQPGAMTKNGDAHRLHLPPLAMAILTDRHRAAGSPRSGLVFLGRARAG
jgi:integrase